MDTTTSKRMAPLTDGDDSATALPAAASTAAASTAAAAASAAASVPAKRKRLAYESDSDEDNERGEEPQPLPQRNVAARTQSAFVGSTSGGGGGGRSQRSPSPGQQQRRSAAPPLSRAATAAVAASSSVASTASSSSSSAGPSSSSRGYDPSLSGCRSVSCYQRLNTIDEGSYGVVHRAVDKVTGAQVALKKIKLEASHIASGFPITSLREINILRTLKHPNIVELVEIVASPPAKGKQQSIYMVMEYAEHDLKALMGRMGAAAEDKLPADASSAANAALQASAAAASGAPVVPPAFKPFRIPEVKCLMQQLLRGVAYAHKNWVLHRDLKMSNLLYNNQGVLKICDFGLARRYGDPLGNYTPLVITLWYRPIELLFGAETYSSAVDMWSCGMLFAEFLLNRPLITGHSEMEQLGKIIKLMGTPDADTWPGFLDLSHAKNYSFNKVLPSRLRELFPSHSYTGGNVLTDQGFDLLERMLTYDPSKRITAAEALAHPYFSEAPLPQSIGLMPTFPASNERMHEETSQPLSGDLRRKREQEAMGFYL